jgi:hypothetical protein
MHKIYHMATDFDEHFFGEWPGISVSVFGLVAVFNVTNTRELV